LKLLLIISQYSPTQTPNTLRWKSILNYFRQKGIEVKVLTTSRLGSSDHEVSKNDISIYRTGYNSLLDRLNFSTKSQSQRNETGKSSFHGRPSNLRLIAENYWPDGSKLFLTPGIKKANEIIVMANISHVISVGLPFTCHLIAREVKEKHPHLIWTMDIQDPFSYSKEFWVNNFVKYEQKNISEEKKAFEMANSITVTNERAKEKYLDLFPFAKAKLKVIPPLFAGYNFNGLTKLFLYGGKIHLAYFGSFYERVRSPESFLEFLVKLKREKPEFYARLQFHLFGQQNKFSYPLFDKYSEVRKSLIIHGFKDRDASMLYMSQMEFLINFGNTTDYHLPSKVVDLLYNNKPIINFTSVNKDTTQVFLNDYDDILNLNLSSLNQDSLNSFENFVSKERIERKVNPSAVETYKSEVIAEIYLSQIKDS